MAKKQGNLAPLVDELGALNDKLAAFAPLARRAEAIKRAIKTELGDALEAHEGATVAGAKYVADVTPQEERQVIRSKARLKTALGERKFIQLAGFQIGQLKDALKPSEFDRLVEKQRIGPRKITVRPIVKG